MESKRSQELYKEIIQDVWISAMQNTRKLGLSRLPEQSEDKGDWEQFQKTLEKLPMILHLEDETSLRRQFNDLELQPDEIDNMKLSLWFYYEELGIEVNDLSDDGMDEAEMEKDVLPFIIESIRGFDTEVTHPTFIGYAWALEELVGNGTPPLWLNSDYRTELVDTMMLESDNGWNNPYYSKALSLWIKDLSN